MSTAAPDPIFDLRKLKCDKARLLYLNDLFKGTAKDKPEQSRRALLCTTIREAGLWPK